MEDKSARRAHLTALQANDPGLPLAQLTRISGSRGQFLMSMCRLAKLRQRTATVSSSNPRPGRRN